MQTSRSNANCINYIFAKKTGFICPVKITPNSIQIDAVVVLDEPTVFCYISDVYLCVLH